MRTTAITFVVLGAVVLGAVVLGAAQQSMISDASTIISRMQSKTRTDRRKAFESAVQLLGSNQLTVDDAARLRLSVINLLSVENSYKVRPVNEQEAEENSEYYSSLVDQVAHFEDARAIPALLGAAQTGGMAIRGVARFGRAALDPTLEQVKSKDADLAEGALYVVQKLLEWHAINDPDAHVRIKNALRESLASPSPGVRVTAVYAIEYLDDREEFVPKLEEIAEHDPFKLRGQPRSNGTVGDFYEVREQASRLLRKIADHTPPTTDRGVTD